MESVKLTMYKLLFSLSGCTMEMSPHWTIRGRHRTAQPHLGQLQFPPPQILESSTQNFGLLIFFSFLFLGCYHKFAQLCFTRLLNSLLPGFFFFFASVVLWLSRCSPFFLLLLILCACARAGERMGGGKGEKPIFSFIRTLSDYDSWQETQPTSRNNATQNVHPPISGSNSCPSGGAWTGTGRCGFG